MRTPIEILEDIVTAAESHRKLAPEDIFSKALQDPKTGWHLFFAEAKRVIALAKQSEVKEENNA